MIAEQFQNEMKLSMISELKVVGGTPTPVNGIPSPALMM